MDINKEKISFLGSEYKREEQDKRIEMEMRASFADLETVNRDGTINLLFLGHSVQIIYYVIKIQAIHLEKERIIRTISYLGDLLDQLDWRDNYQRYQVYFMCSRILYHLSSYPDSQFSRLINVDFHHNFKQILLYNYNC